MPINPTMIAVNSSLLREVGYDGPSETLRVTFSSGSTWDYADVSMAEYEALMHASSVGKAFNSMIKGQKPGNRV